MNDEYNTTCNNGIYKKLRKKMLNNKGLIKCTYCKYHRGENRTRKPSQYGHYRFNRRAI